MGTEGIVIERSRHAQEFVIIGNAEARDGRLSFRARGLHHHLLSLPPGWRVTSSDLSKDNPEGREAIRTALRELVNLGYVTREKRQDARGRWYTVMTVHDKPQDTPPPGETGFSTGSGTEDGFPGVGNPDPGSPGVGGPGAKDLKTVTKNDEEKDLKMASRRAHSSGASANWTIGRVVRDVRGAVAQVHGQQEADSLTDGDALGLFYTYVKEARPRDLVAYVVSIIECAPYLDTFLANVEAACTSCAQWESSCACAT